MKHGSFANVRKALRENDANRLFPVLWSIEVLLRWLRHSLIDPCTGKNCAPFGLCKSMEGLAICQCDDGLHFDDLPCQGNFDRISSSLRPLLTFVTQIPVEIKLAFLVFAQERDTSRTKPFAHVQSTAKVIPANIQMVCHLLLRVLIHRRKTNRSDVCRNNSRCGGGGYCKLDPSFPHGYACICEYGHMQADPCPPSKSKKRIQIEFLEPRDCSDMR